MQCTTVGKASGPTRVSDALMLMVWLAKEVLVEPVLLEEAVQAV